MDYVFTPLERASARIFNSTKYFPIHRIYCVGRNYAEHIREMGFDPDREPPFFFQKPADAYVPNKIDIVYPLDSEDFQFEIELVVAIGKSGRNISIEDANSYIWGYGTGIDLTRRDRQLQARERGRPWEPGKAFDQSAPIADLVSVEESGIIDKGRIWLKVNGEMKQDSVLEKLVWSVPEVISILSQTVDLQPGDLIMTGTPAGVGPLVPGDELEGGVEGLPGISFKVVART